ncbi:P-loop containing nucleoside triphosphate hydrolase protein [Kalaharituber pfeilii]|nr:P-loop containing nucleoside triphosphate hydrolase protein [Kalaharituber pfeilii]
MDITQVVLYGMGGMGKTQLALEYVYRHSRDYSSVFWINGVSEETMKTSFIHIMQRLVECHATLSHPYEPDYTYIGRLLGIAGKLDPAGMLTVQQPSEEQQVVTAVKNWFAAKHNTKWLLVFDNLDDLESFESIPQLAHGTVIITSRRRERVQGRRCLEVKQMDNSEAQKLLFNSAKPDFEKLTPDQLDREKEAAATIVQKLDCLPLAIDQAGALIYARQYSFSRYLTEYNTNVTYILSQEWKVGKPDRSVFAAWDLSFNAIQNHKSEAAELLLLCGLLDKNDICEELLQRGMKLPVHALEESIQILFSYSMAKRKDRDDSFSIHPLVHMWAQWKLEKEPERHSKKAIEALLVVASAIDIYTSRKREVKDWAFEQRILPHIIALQEQMKTLVLEHLNMEILKAVDNMCRVYFWHGYYKEAEEVCKVLLVESEKLLGPEDPDTLSIVNIMAMIFKQRGQYGNALELFVRALAGMEKALGADHPDTLCTVSNMAMTFQQQGQYNKSLGFYERALAGIEKALGPDHPKTLLIVDSMAGLFRQRGQFDEALELCERTVAGMEKALGPDDLNTLCAVNNMAMTLEKQGQYNKALEFFERALAGTEKAMGSDHPNTLVAVSNIAETLRQLGQYNKSLEFFQRALAGTEKALGPDHPDTLAVVYAMAALFYQQGQYNKSLEFSQRALAGTEKALGPDHPNTLYVVNRIATALKHRGQYNKALEYNERAVSGIQRALGADHPDSLAMIRNMADTFEAIGQSDKARELWERASRGNSANPGI